MNEIAHLTKDNVPQKFYTKVRTEWCNNRDVKLELFS